MKQLPLHPLLSGYISTHVMTFIRTIRNGTHGYRRSWIQLSSQFLQSRIRRGLLKGNICLWWSDTWKPYTQTKPGSHCVCCLGLQSVFYIIPCRHQTSSTGPGVSISVSVSLHVKAVLVTLSVPGGYRDTWIKAPWLTKTTDTKWASRGAAVVITQVRSLCKTTITSRCGRHLSGKMTASVRNNQSVTDHKLLKPPALLLMCRFFSYRFHTYQWNWSMELCELYGVLRSFSGVMLC